MIIFASVRPLDRAENIKAVWDKWDGPKKFVQLDVYRANEELCRGDLLVTDEFVRLTPGRCIMIGHGISAFKKYGLDQPYAYHTHKDADLLTYVITSGKKMIPIVAQQSGVPEERVLALGLPRTDSYFDHTRTSGKRTYLYLPTFRDYTGNVLDDTDWNYLDSQLTDDEVLLIKPHMLQEDAHIDLKHIRSVSRMLPTTPYLMECDVVITDYSSILFDAYVVNKNVVLYEKDREKYADYRGFYLEYPTDYSAKHCRDEDELIELIRDDSVERVKAHEYIEMCDGHSTDRVIDLIKSERSKT